MKQFFAAVPVKGGGADDIWSHIRGADRIISTSQSSFKMTGF